MTLVVQMHGEPGSGKSTLARALAPLIGAVVLDKDVIKSALMASPADRTNADIGGAAYEVYFALADDLVAQGRSVILDNPVFWPRVEERWKALSHDAGSDLLLIHCVCPDREELQARLLVRDALASQPRSPLDLLQHAGAAETQHYPRLVLDTTRSLDEIVEEAAAYVFAGVTA
jgi:predicted kinase